MKRLYLTSVALILGSQICQAIDVTPVNNFDVNKYIGNWYEIARLPNKYEAKCLAPVTASYAPDPDNNKQLIVTNQCITREGRKTITGIAKFVDTANVGKLKVSFLPKSLRWLMPFGYGDYWVLQVDYDNMAVVGSPDHENLWILSRSNKITKETLDTRCSSFLL